MARSDASGESVTEEQFEKFLSELDDIAPKHLLACGSYLLWFILFSAATLVLGYYSNRPVCTYLFPILSAVTTFLNHWSRAWKHFAFHQMCMKYKISYNYEFQFPKDAGYAKDMIDNFQTTRLSLTDVPGKNDYKWPYFLIISFFNLPGVNGSNSPYGAIKNSVPQS